MGFSKKQLAERVDLHGVRWPVAEDSESHIQSPPRNNFELWMVRCGLSSSYEAAILLHIGETQARNYIRGRSPSTGNDLTPPYATRMLMRLLANKLPIPEPWPE